MVGDEIGWKVLFLKNINLQEQRKNKGSGKIPVSFSNIAE